MKTIRTPQVQVKFPGSYNLFYLVFFGFYGHYELGNNTTQHATTQHNTRQHK